MELYYTHIEQIEHNTPSEASLDVRLVKLSGLLALICKAALRGEIFPIRLFGILMQVH